MADARAEPVPDGPVLHAEDAALVRAPAPWVYERLIDLPSWPLWWQGCRVVSLDARGMPGHHLVELATGWGRQLRLVVRPHGWRQDVGVVLGLSGDLVGRSEYWLERNQHGTVVHHLLVARTRLPRAQRVVDQHRAAVRRGLWGLKDLLQVETRTAAGLLP